MAIDRRAVVGRHDVRLTAPDAGVVLGVGNGEFGVNADVTGLQTFTEFHQPAPDMSAPLDPSAPRVTNTSTMSNWGWDSAPNIEGYELAEATEDYPSALGSVPYLVKPDFAKLFAGQPLDRGESAGLYFIDNPHRVDLGRLGLVLCPEPGAEPEEDPAVLEDLDVHLDLWTGVLTSSFTYRGESVRVVTAAHGESSAVATRVTSPHLRAGRLGLRLAFAKPVSGFAVDNDWGAVEGHASELEARGDGAATIHRTLQTSRYAVDVAWTDGVLAADGPHRFVLAGFDGESAEVVVDYRPVEGPGAEWYRPAAERPRTFEAVVASSRGFWESFWRSGAAVDFAGSADPRAHELERRVVLSQYLTRVHGGGVLPPQETGFVTQSWNGKFHLEMHWWHAAHFPSWGRPELLERSLGWYESIHHLARATAETQGYSGVRWPKQVAPDGVESPSNIGALLIWQQPHLLSFAELLWDASADDPATRRALADRLGPLLDDTAAFMVDYADEADGVFHLGPPVMPAQEFYDPRETADPTYELAYWSFGLELAGRFRERRGLPRDEAAERVRAAMAPPTVHHGRYAAVAGEAETRPDDHPSMLMAYGFVPASPAVDPATMRATLDWALENWQWDSAWGWDFPVMAMTAARMADADAAVDVLLRDARKNRYDAAGHNPQMGSFLPLYLPGNGGVLAAVSLMVAGWRGGPELPGIPADGWVVAHEGLVPWPAYDNLPEPERTPE